MKKVLCFVLALVLVLGSSIAVFADENSYGDDEYGYGYENDVEENDYEYDVEEDENVADENGDDDEYVGDENGDEEDDEYDYDYETDEEDEEAATSWTAFLAGPWGWYTRTWEAPVDGTFAITGTLTVFEPVALEVDSPLDDVEVRDVNGRGYVRFRSAVEAFGRTDELSWDSANRVVTFAEFSFGIEGLVFIENNSTYVPLDVASAVTEL